MRVLLDSNALLWWLVSPSGLTARAREAIADPQTDVLFSPVSIYELLYKYRLGKLEDDVGGLRPAALADGFMELAITGVHAAIAANLAWANRDPWDRLIAAQATAEACPVVSADRAFDEIRVERLW